LVQQQQQQQQEELQQCTEASEAPQQQAGSGCADSAQANPADSSSEDNDCASDGNTADDSSFDDNAEGAAEVQQPVARRLRSGHPALLQRLVVLSRDSSQPQALVLEPPPVKAARRKQRTGPLRRPMNEQQLQQHWGALLSEEAAAHGDAGSEHTAPDVPVPDPQQQQQQQQEEGNAAQAQQDLQLPAGSESSQSDHSRGLKLALVAAGQQPPPGFEAGAATLQQQQQQEQQLAVGGEALPAPPPLQHLVPDEDEEEPAEPQGMLPQLPALNTDQQQLCSDPALLWTPQRLKALLLNSSDEQQPADAAVAAGAIAAEPAEAGVLAAAPPTVVVAAAAAAVQPVDGYETAAASLDCRVTMQSSGASGCDTAQQLSGGEDGTCCNGNGAAGAWPGCDGQALLATSKQAAQLERQMLPLFTHEHPAAGTLATTTTAAAVGSDGVLGQHSSSVRAADACSLKPGVAGSSDANPGAAGCLCPAAAAGGEDAQLLEDNSDHHEQQEQQQAAMQGQQQQCCSDQLDADQALPAKDAQPGDYLKVEPNSRWDPVAFEAAAGAAQLGVPVAVLAHQPVVQRSSGQAQQQQQQQQAEDASDKATSRSGSVEEAAAAKSARSEESVAAAAGEGRLPAAAATAELGVLMLAHDKGVTHAAAWQAWEEAHDGRAVVLVHLKAGVTLAATAAGSEWLASGRQLHKRVASQWGDISLTQAVLDSAAEMLQRCPRLQHIAVVSGQDVPVAALQLPLPQGASVIGCFQFGREYDAAARRVAAAVLQQQLGMAGAEAEAWGDSLTFHHTWLVFNRWVGHVTGVLRASKQHSSDAGVIRQLWLSDCRPVVVGAWACRPVVRVPARHAEVMEGLAGCRKRFWSLIPGCTTSKLTYRAYKE
jgi:hypothetical protein